MATHSSILAWEIPWTEETGRLQSTRSERVGQDRGTSLSLSPPNKTCLQIHLHWRLEFQHNLFQKDTVQFSVEALGLMRHW